MSESMNRADELVKIYLTIRNEKARLADQIKALEADMDHIETALLAICNDSGTTGGKTENGSFVRKLNERYVCSDWGSFKPFLETEGSIDLLEQRIHQGNFKKFMAERQGDGLPPGLNVLREYTVVVSKPRTSSETLV